MQRTIDRGVCQYEGLARSSTANDAGMTLVTLQQAPRLAYRAQPACETQAVGKDGKPLSGAAKTAFINKCKKNACEPKAVGSDGKPLAGAAKASFMKKCQSGA